MLLRQWEDEVAWFAHGAKLRPTLSERIAGMRETCRKSVLASKMLIIDDLLLWLPAKGLMAVFKKIHDLAEQELNDDSKLKEELLRYQTMFELDQISEKEYQAREDEIIARLNAVQERKKQQLS